MAQVYSESDFSDSAPQSQVFNESDFKDSVAPSMNAPQLADITGQSSGLLGHAVGSFLQDPQGSTLNQGLLTNNPVGFIGSTIRGIPATVGGSIAGVPGAMIGEGLRQVGVNSEAALTGQTPASPFAVGTNIATAGLLQGAAEEAAPYISAGITKAAGAFGDAAQGILKYAGINLAGVKPGSYNFASGATSAISPDATAAIGQSATADAIRAAGQSNVVPNGNLVHSYIGADPSVGDALAQKVRDSISGALDEGSQAYKSIADSITQGPQPPTIDLNGTIGDTVQRIKELNGYARPVEATADISKPTGLLDQFGKSIENITPGSPAIDGVKRIVSPDEVAKFGKFADQIASMDKATPEQVYYLQRDLNAAIQQNKGSPLAQALGGIKSAINSNLSKMAANSGSEGLAQLAKANSTYAAAKALEEQTGKLTNANDLINYVSKSYQNPHATLAKQALDDAASKVPGLGDALNEIQAYSAAKSFEPLLRGIPATGYGAAAIYGAGAGVHSAINAFGGGPAENIGAGILAAFGGAVSSPRLALGALRASQAVGPSLAEGSSSLARVAPTLTPLAAQALRANMSPESISAFQKGLAEHYRSPGQ